ncbi:MAG TPA: TonB-dependent receptor, partial [Steroidobacteraceae bacterium]|nr:TonB-dependent receptor [Steroidobacteraceae bacterium]
EDDVTFTQGTTLEAPQLRDESTFDATTPRLVLSWRPSDETTLYTSYAEGFRSGFAQNLQTQGALPGTPPVEPDTLKNYEVGIKGNVADGRVGYEAAVYFIDWQDVQQPLSIIVNGLPVASSVNGESASGVGVDLASTFRPTDQLALGLSFSWNDLTFDTDVVSGGFVLFAEGDRLNYSPEYTLGASADYRFPLGGGGFEATVSLSANYTSEQDLRTLLGAPFHTVGDEMLLARASFTVASAEHWNASLFADNIANEDGTPIRSPAAVPDFSVRVRPRTIGLQLEYRF